MNLDNIFNKLRSDIFVAGGKREYYTGYAHNGQEICSGSISTGGVYKAGEPIYGNPTKAASQSSGLKCGGQYDLVGGTYSPIMTEGIIVPSFAWVGSYDMDAYQDEFLCASVVREVGDFRSTNARLCMFDPDIQNDLENGELDYQFLFVPVKDIEEGIPNADIGESSRIQYISISDLGYFAKDAVPWGNKYQGGLDILNLRRCNERGDWDGEKFTRNAIDGKYIKFVIRLKEDGEAINMHNQPITIKTRSIEDPYSTKNKPEPDFGPPSFESDFGAPPSFESDFAICKSLAKK